MRKPVIVESDAKAVNDLKIDLLSAISALLYLDRWVDVRATLAASGDGRFDRLLKRLEFPPPS